jgi:hypothetical protein
VIEDIARRLKNLNFASAAWQVQRLSESGALYKDILKKLSKLTGQSESALREILKQAGVKAIKFDDAIYKAAGLNPLPLNMSPAMVQALKAALDKTNGVINNLTKTTVLNAQQTFIKAADLAYYQVSTGVMSYDQAIRMAVKKLAADGLDVVDYASGHRDKVDVAMRRAVLTGVAQTANTLQMTRADEMGSDLVAVSAHIGARNTGTGTENHQQWQGKIYSRSGTHPKYPDFVKSTGYGTGEGLGGWNCRHSFYPFFEGLSENAYSRKELNEYASKKVTYQGKEIDVYTATQYQRGIERKIREWKRQEAALKAAGQDATFETGKVKQWQATMRDFINQTGLDRQSVREQIITSGGGSVAPIAPVTPIAPIVPEPPIVNNAVVPGLPVSNALDVTGITNKTMKSQIDLAMKTIDKIHGDGNLPIIPILQSGAGRNYGTFSFGWDDKPIKISISPKGDHQALTTLHEVGHFIDNAGVSNRRWTSEIYGIENNRIVEVAKKSKWWTGIGDRIKKFAELSDRPISISPKYVRYLQGSKEVFARAYAQFIAMESGDPILMAQLRKLQEQAFSTQWSDEDFKPIAEEFRKLFKERGWMS